MFDADSDRADDAGFAARSKDDRHHFRFIISPEDAAELTDLRAFTRDLARQMEADLGTRLDWVAVDHWNTDNPHVHLLVRGVDAQGTDLVISRDYISRGLRSRAEDLVSIELGPKPEHEIKTALEREITAERWTRLDVEIRIAADETGFIDLRPEQSGAGDPQTRRLMIGRLQHLEKMGLASSARPGEWMVGLDAERHLRDLGLRGDIIKTMHRAFAERGEDRAVADYVIEGGSGQAPIIGRLVDRGLQDELTGEAYAVIDGTDGRAHHVRFRGVEAFEHTPAIGGIVEVRRFGRADEPHPTLVLAPRSDLDLSRQIRAPGATWLDHRLVEADPIPLSMGGFGREVRDALQARAEHLADQGLGRRQGQRIILQRDLLATLRRRELDAVGARLSAETGLAHMKPTAGDQVAGIYRQRLDLSSGRFAMIDNGLGFQLVPWSREIERKLGQHVAGAMKDGGGIEWGLGRKRGLAL
jgi:type IV secretory pathway VirD2 relaxase